MNDLKFAIRQVLRNPGFAAVAVVSLGLGIGACTSVFSVVNAVLLRSLPVPEPQALRVLEWVGIDARPRSVTGRFETHGNRSVGESVSPEAYQALREQAAGLAEVFAFAPLDSVAARVHTEATGVNGMIVSDNFFSALRARPALGRLYHPGNVDADAAQQVVITTEWWERDFAAHPDVIGQTVILNGASHVIVGVLPRGFPGVRPGDPRSFYVLLTPQSRFLERAVSSPDHWWLRMMARVHQGSSDAQLEAVLSGVFARAAEGQMKSPRMVVHPGRGGLAYDRTAYRKPLMLMLGAVVMVMLVACANLAGLSLARGAARRHELSVRAALGAGRWRLIRQSLTECMLLVALGTGLGSMLAVWGQSVISRLLLGTVRQPEPHSGPPLDLAVLGFLVLAAVFTGLLSGLLPALRAGAADPMGGLKARSALGNSRLKTGRILVLAQIGLSVLLLAGAGLFLRSLSSLLNMPTGFETDRLLTFRVNPPSTDDQGTGLSAFYDRVQTSVAALPGARGASVMLFPLLDNKSSSGGFFIHGRAEQSDRQQAHRLVVSETFLATLGIPLREGRNFSAGDGPDDPKVVVVNETFVRRYFPNENPIGRSIGTWRSEWQIVGVCGDVRYQHIKDPVPPTVYIPFRQFPLRFGAYIAVRTALPPLELATAVRKAVAAIDPAVPVMSLTTQEDIINGTIRQERWSATLGAALAGFALLLACIGLYGLMAYNVTRRSGEIAIRMALGAQAFEVAGAIVKEALLLTVGGIILGIPAVLAVMHLVRSQLHGVEPHDPLTLMAVTVTLLAVGVASAWLPARRAARISPLEALRND